jgi:hypothetical protein
MLRAKIVLILLLLSLHVCSVHAQETEIDSAVIGDTALYQPEIVTQSAEQVGNPVDLEKRLTQRPTTALFKSMFVPGLGQFGNGKPVKAVFVIGLQTWLITSALKHHNNASDLRERWEREDVTDERNSLYDLYQEERDQRNKFYWFTGITTFVSMFDAFVDAHLSGSPSSQKENSLDVSVAPDFNTGGAQARLSYSF